MDTQARIKKALFELLDKHSFTNLTVTMICQQAQVSRPTFYKYFIDKYDLVTTAYEEEMTRCMNHDSWWQIMISALSYIREHQTYIREILNYHGQNLFVDFLLDYTRKCTVSLIKSKEILNSAKMNYSLSIYTYGVCYTLIDWVKDGCHDSPEDFTRILNIEMPTTLKKYLLTK